MERLAQGNNTVNQKGFSTLFIVIILGSMVLALAIAFASSSVFVLRSSVNFEKSAKARAVANACAESALEHIKLDNMHSGENVILIDSYECTYHIIHQGDEKRSIEVSGNVDRVIRRIRIETSSFNPLVISFWKEV